MFSTGTNLASNTPKKFKKVSISYLVPVLLVEKWPKKNAKMNLVPVTESKTLFLFVDSVAGTKYGGFRYFWYHFSMLYFNIIFNIIFNFFPGELFYFPNEITGLNELSKKNKIILIHSFFWRFNRFNWKIGSVLILKPFHHGITLSFFNLKRFNCKKLNSKLKVFYSIVVMHLWSRSYL